MPVVDRDNEDAWIARAVTVTAQRLADEVNWVRERRDALGSHVSLDPPPLDSDLASAVAQTLAYECRKTSPTAALQNGAHTDGVFNAEVASSPRDPPRGDSHVGNGAAPRLLAARLRPGQPPLLSFVGNRVWNEDASDDQRRAAAT